MSSVNKVVLAYSGGLDTSVIVKWLQEEYQCEVVTFTADIGQGEEVEPARAKAQALGVKEIYIDDLREEYAKDYVFPMFRANAIYEGEYLLGTSIARPLIAKRLIEIANETNADAISHGATGKGNDQVRFELGAYALKPGIQVIAPWREWDLNSRDKLMDYCEKHSIPVEMKRGKKSPFSMDANLLHISYEGGNLEDPWSEAEDDMWRWTVSPEEAPDEPTYLDLSYQQGDIVAIDGKPMSAATVIEYLNEGNYCGLEVRADVLNEGRKELKEEGLENKKPELVHFNDFNELHFDTKFDMAFAFSVLIHLDDDIAEKCFDFVGRHLSEKGVFFANVNLSERESGNWQGFPVMYKELSFYENFAAKNSLVVKNLGALKDLGHISNQPVADEQIMLAFTRK